MNHSYTNHLVTSNRLISLYPPPAKGVNWNAKITKNFTFKEWFDSVKAFEEEKENLLNHGFPIAKNILQAPQLVRDFTGKPVYLGSSYRTFKWESSKGRPLDGDHPLGNGVDVNGEDVIETLLNALQTKNELYTELRKLGINAFGVYDWGFHLGSKPEKKSGAIYYWDDRKKKDNSIGSLGIPLLLLAIIFWKQIKKFLKIR